MWQDLISSTQTCISLPHKHTFECHSFAIAPLQTYPNFYSFLHYYFESSSLAQLSFPCSTWSRQMPSLVLTFQTHGFSLVHHTSFPSSVPFAVWSQASFCSFTLTALAVNTFSSVTCHLKQIASFSLLHQFILSFQISIKSIDFLTMLYLLIFFHCVISFMPEHLN